jgi:hypothetical protein
MAAFSGQLAHDPPNHLFAKCLSPRGRKRREKEDRKRRTDGTDTGKGGQTELILKKKASAIAVESRTIQKYPHGRRTRFPERLFGTARKVGAIKFPVAVWKQVKLPITPLYIRI